MHETLLSNVKAYVDDLHFENGGISVRGWILHQDKDNLPIRIQGASHIINLSYEDREDVERFFNRHTKCGWSLLYPVIETIDLEIYDNEKLEWNVVAHLYTHVQPQIGELYPSFVVIDNFYKNPDEVREFALKCKFHEHPKYHKGRRTDELYRFEGLKESFEKTLGRKIRNWDYYGTNGCFQYCIGGDQLVYHFDGQTYAGLLYLTPDAPPQTGTSFYRSKITKKMKVSDSEHSVVFKNGFLDPTMFDLVDTVGNVYNRLILFDAKFIHAASCYFGNTKENSRLFQLFFFDFE